MRRIILILIAGILLVSCSDESPDNSLAAPATTIDIERAIKSVSIDETGYAYECFADAPTSPLPYGCNMDPAATYEYFQGAWRKR